MLRRLLITSAVALFALPAVAQEATLADIRQQLSVLYVDIQRLKTELSTTGGASDGVSGNTPLERLDAIEAELQQLTSKTEELEFRVNRITVDGTNRIGDLEFRLCELEPACDIATLGDTPSLGGVDNGSGVPTAALPPASEGPALAIGEQADFMRAKEALEAGDYRSAADILASFGTSYPGSPVGAEAALMKGEAYEGLGETSNAARAFLESFSTSPDGATAPQALFRLGAALGALGQGQDACITLSEVGVRFPGNPFVTDAQTEMVKLGCQ